MYNLLIKNYIKKLSISDVNDFAIKNNIMLNDNELNIIFNYIKSDYNTILYGDPTNILNNLKENFDDSTYLKIEKLFFEYKDKYKNYL